MTDHRYRERPRHAGPTPAQVLVPAASVVLTLLLLALVAQPGAFLVRVGGEVGSSSADVGPVGADGSAGPDGPAAGGQAAPPRADPAGPADADQQGGRTDPADPADPADPTGAGSAGDDAATALAELLLARDAAVRYGDPAGWTASSGDATDATAADGSFAVLASLPVTRFESSLEPGSVRAVEDPVAGEDVEVRVETVYALADATPVVRTDTVALDAPVAGRGWRVVSWQPYPGLGQVGTAAPWDLGPVHASVGERGVVLAWVDPATADDGSVPAQGLQDAQAWGDRVSGWVDEGAVVVDSYLGTGWPRTTVVMAPATTQQYDALVPGPAPARPDVFAAVTTDVRTEDGGGDVVVVNPTARADLVPQTWQVTLTHELVHVASGSRYGDGQEVWLAEGLADLVGWSGVVPGEATREQVAGRLLERVADGRADLQELPGATDFAAADADVVGDAYEGAWLGALLLQDELGVDGLLAVYEDASDGPGTARQRTDDALRTATGEGREAFRSRWSTYVGDLAAG